MTKIAYLECPTGIAGDMCLGALVHAGVPLDYLTIQLQRLGIADDYRLWAETILRNGQAATKVHVDLKHPPDLERAAQVEEGVDPHLTFGSHSAIVHAAAHEHQAGRHLPEIEQLILAAELPPRATAWSLAVFRQLAIAEGAVHGIAPEAVHFHEVGATDAIVDIVGTCLGLDWLAIDQLYCSALPVGGGTVWAAHGRLPVPTPAVLKLWEMRQVPIYSNGIDKELVTPTGAAIATTLATAFGPPPPMRLQRVGLGAGSRNLPIPNMVRLWLGDTEAENPNPTIAHTQPHETPFHFHPAPTNRLTHTPADAPGAEETIAVLETQLDDASPQAIAFALEALLAAGALDVFTQAIAMKKSRLGTLVTVICRPDHIAACEGVLFQETTTLGIRRTLQQRTVLPRQMDRVEVLQTPIRVKVARAATPSEQVLNVQPEYEDCAQLARSTHRPLAEIQRLAVEAWHSSPRSLTKEYE